MPVTMDSGSVVQSGRVGRGSLKDDEWGHDLKSE